MRRERRRKEREGIKTQLSFSSQRPMRLRVMIKRRRAMEKEKGKRERGRKEEGRGRERSPIRGDFPGWRCCFPPFHWGKDQACNFGISRIRSSPSTLEYHDTQDTLSPLRVDWVNAVLYITVFNSRIQLSFVALYTLRTTYCLPVPDRSSRSLPQFTVLYGTVRLRGSLRQWSLRDAVQLLSLSLMYKY